MNQRIPRWLWNIKPHKVPPATTALIKRALKTRDKVDAMRGIRSKRSKRAQVRVLAAAKADGVPVPEKLQIQAIEELMMALLNLDSKPLYQYGRAIDDLKRNRKPASQKKGGPLRPNEYDAWVVHKNYPGPGLPWLSELHRRVNERRKRDGKRPIDKTYLGTIYERLALPMTRGKGGRPKKK
jgi:hypothetical protein